jgi:hypothetical protein
MNENIRLISRMFSLAILNALVMYVVFNNFPLTYLSLPIDAKNLSEIGPKDRVITENILGENIQKVVDDITYFTAKTSGFNEATIRITFRNDNPNQDLFIGFKDKKEWHYNTKPVDLHLINNLNWNSISDNTTTLYSQGGNNNYGSVQQFYSDPPHNVVVGNYFSEETPSPSTILVDYRPSDKITTLDTPLRGSHTFYVYLRNEPFILKILKQDLNWYIGEDLLTVQIYKNGELLTERKIGDDGITDNSKKEGIIQPLVIEYLGDNYPEAGVYKIVMQSNSDVVVKSIKTNLHKIAFVGPIFPINNSNIYNKNIATNYPLDIYTNTPEAHIKALHKQTLENVYVDSEPITINDVNTDYIVGLTNPLTNIQANNGDIIIAGSGYFSFSKDQFFLPFPYLTSNIKTNEDLSLVQYLLTNYKKPYINNGWSTAEVTFNLKDAYYEKGKLSWVIKAPGLKSSQSEISIKSIDLIMHKNPIFKL